MKIAILGDFFVEEPDTVNINNDIKNLLASCDYRVLNFEGPIDDGKKHRIQKSGPRIKQPISSIQVLRNLGIDALTLANNHIMDNGSEGINYTKEVLSDFNLMGAGSWKGAYQINIVIIGGVKVGFLNVCEMQFGMLYDTWSQSNEAVGSAWINHPAVNRLILNAKDSVDYLIAICHAGLENIDAPLPEWRDRYRELVDMGCNAVIAHHAHVVQGLEIYKSAPICYSLGNFCFPTPDKTNDDNWNTGAIAVLDLDYGKISIQLYGCKYEHHCICIWDNDQWRKRIEELCHKLKEDNYLPYISQKCVSLLPIYWDLFAMGGLFNPQRISIKSIGRVLLNRYNIIHLLNNLQCESHRWCVSRAIRVVLRERNGYEEL